MSSFLFIPKGIKVTQLPIHQRLSSEGHWVKIGQSFTVIQ